MKCAQTKLERSQNLLATIRQFLKSSQVFNEKVGATFGADFTPFSLRVRPTLPFGKNLGNTKWEGFDQENWESEAGEEKSTPFTKYESILSDASSGWSWTVRWPKTCLWRSGTLSSLLWKQSRS